MSEPKGMIAMFLAPDGHVVAHAADFHTDHPGGYSVREAQQHRARQAMWHATVRAMCNLDLAECVSTHQCEQILQDMCRKKGYRMEEIAIGYKDD